MSIIYEAQLTPSKLDAAREWIVRQDWFDGDAPSLERVAALRWEDPAGEVGVETLILVDSNGSFFAAPFTYRGAEFPAATLVTTMDHSVLGDRWVYEGPSDPVFLACALDAVRTGEAQSELEVHDGETVTKGEHTVDAEVVGEGTDAADVVVNYTLDPAVDAEAGVRGTWAGQDSPVFLVSVV
jgi:hypothetical protein